MCPCFSWSVGIGQRGRGYNLRDLSPPNRPCVHWELWKPKCAGNKPEGKQQANHQSKNVPLSNILRGIYSLVYSSLLFWKSARIFITSHDWTIPRSLQIQLVRSRDNGPLREPHALAGSVSSRLFPLSACLCLHCLKGTTAGDTQRERDTLFWLNLTWKLSNLAYFFVLVLCHVLKTRYTVTEKVEDPGQGHTYFLTAINALISVIMSLYLKITDYHFGYNQAASPMLNYDEIVCVVYLDSSFSETWAIIYLEYICLRSYLV